MPTPPPAEPTRRRPDPATAPLDELLAHLATDPTVGLTPKEAARRCAHSTATPLYATTARRPSACFGRVLREPVLWMLVAVSLIALFFDRVALGLVCLLLAGGHAVLCALFCRRADRIDAVMQTAYDAPLSRVLRTRRVRRVGASDVVRGDILLFYPGDLIPADCRLIRTEHFSVSERAIDGGDQSRPVTRLEKDAEATSEAAENRRYSPANMVYAGGVVETGFALAVAVAVGSETHLGGLVGTVAPAHTDRRSTVKRQGARILSIYNLGLVILTIPLIAVGIFTLGEHHDFLDIFLSAMALASLTLTEHLLARARFADASVRRDAAVDRDTDNTADIKTSVESENLLKVTDLLLVGTAALHDGGAHPETIQIGDATYHCDRPEADEYASAVAELLYVYRYGRTGLPVASSGAWDADRMAELDRLVPAVCAWAEIDTEALLLRIKEIHPDGDGVSGIFPNATGNQRLTVSLIADFDSLPQAAENDSAREVLYRDYRAAIRTGYRVLFVTTIAHGGLSDGECSVRAMLTYAPHICPKTAGAVRSMETAGIRVTAFLRNVSEENTRILAACGLTDGMPAYRLPADDFRDPAAKLIDGGIRAIEGCNTSYILKCIDDLHAVGRTVAVLSVEDGDISLLDAADVAMTCTPSLYMTAETDIPGLPLDMPTASVSLPTGPDGLPSSVLATDLCRRRADVLVRRATETGGGVCGVRHALLAADHAKATLDRTFSFLLFAQTIRLVAVILPLILGLALTSAPILLLSGCILDVLVALALPRLPLDHSPRARCTITDGLTPPFRALRPRWILSAVSAAIPWIIAFVASLLEVDFGAGLTLYGLVCLAALQPAVLRSIRLPRRNRTAFFTTCILLLLYVAALAVALAAGLGLLWALVFPLVGPIVYATASWIIDRISA